MAHLLVVIIGVAFLVSEASCDGYPKGPTATSPQGDSGSGSGQSPSAVPVASPPSLQPLDSVLYPDAYSRLYPSLYAAGYPPVSTDYVSRYYGPTAVPSVLPDGHLADTAAVAAARAAHIDALARARALGYGSADDGSYDPYKYGDYAYNYLRGGYYGGQGALNRPYYGPLASPTVLPSGYLADTPAVAAARANHLSLAKARADAALWRAKYYKG